MARIPTEGEGELVKQQAERARREQMGSRRIHAEAQSPRVRAVVRPGSCGCRPAGERRAEGGWIGLQREAGLGLHPDAAVRLSQAGEASPGCGSPPAEARSLLLAASKEV